MSGSGRDGHVGALMPGEEDLQTLLRHMEPVLSPEPHGYALIYGPVPDGLHPFVVVAEAEGMTVIATGAALTETGIDPGKPFARLSLTIHSSLDAVGLTAAIAAALAAEGISANVVAGYHHDHIFVPWDRRDDALAALKALRGA